MNCPKCNEQYIAKPYELRNDELCPRCALNIKEEIPLKNKEAGEELSVLSLDDKREINVSPTIDKSKLDEIKKLWEKEVDNYLIKAATIDLNEYPLEIQQIIKNELTKRGLVGAKFQKPSVIVETGDNVVGNARSFFTTERSLIKLGVTGGLIMMIGSVIWFFLGLLFGWLFYYPPILFAIGLFAFLKGLLTGNVVVNFRIFINVLSRWS